jgi:hypothetical protein
LQRLQIAPAIAGAIFILGYNYDFVGHIDSSGTHTLNIQD